MTKSWIILASLLLVIILSTFNPITFSSGSTLFKIKNIEIENTNVIKKENLYKLFNSELYFSNLLTVNEDKILEVLKNNKLIKSIEIRKIYPNKLKIKIYEKEPIAIINNKKETYYLTKQGEEIKFFNNDILTNLPKIFGSQKNFLEIYSSLINLDFSISDIKSFYYFDIGRWDIIFKNSKTVKLPVNNFDESLKNYKSLSQDPNFEKYLIFDYRINNQLILN